MDELMIKTIGLMETIPERIGSLEKNIRELEISFSKHEGSSEQGVKRMVDRIENIEKAIEEIRKAKNLDDVKQKVGELEEAIKPLIDDLDGRKETGKTIKQYMKEAILAFIRYAMLPMTIAILLLMGMKPEYIPWYKTPSVKEESKDGATKDTNKKHDNKNRPNN